MSTLYLRFALSEVLKRVTRYRLVRAQAASHNRTRLKRWGRIGEKDVAKIGLPIDEHAKISVSSKRRYRETRVPIELEPSSKGLPGHREPAPGSCPSAPPCCCCMRFLSASSSWLFRKAFSIALRTERDHRLVQPWHSGARVGRRS